jgi:hypothetical protein
MKKKVTNADELTQAITELELKASTQKQDIRETFAVVSENMKPANLVKNGVRSVFSGKHNDEMLNILIGLGTGILSKKLFFGRAKGFLGKTAGMALEWGMAALVSKNAEKIKEKGTEWIDRIFKKQEPDSNHKPVHGQKKITS